MNDTITKATKDVVAYLADPDQGGKSAFTGKLVHQVWAARGILGTKGLGPIDLLVLIAIIARIGRKTGYSWPGHGAICADSGLPESTVKKALRSLIRTEVLLDFWLADRKSKCYTLNLEMIRSSNYTGGEWVQREKNIRKKKGATGTPLGLDAEEGLPDNPGEGYLLTLGGLSDNSRGVTTKPKGGYPVTPNKSSQRVQGTGSWNPVQSTSPAADLIDIRPPWAQPSTATATAKAKAKTDNPAPEEVAPPACAGFALVADSSACTEGAPAPNSDALSPDPASVAVDSILDHLVETGRLSPQDRPLHRRYTHGLIQYILEHSGEDAFWAAAIPALNAPDRFDWLRRFTSNYYANTMEELFRKYGPTEPLPVPAEPTRADDEVPVPDTDEPFVDLTYLLDPNRPRY